MATIRGRYISLTSGSFPLVFERELVPDRARGAVLAGDDWIDQTFPEYDRAAWSHGRLPVAVKECGELIAAARYRFCSLDAEAPLSEEALDRITRMEDRAEAKAHAIKGTRLALPGGGFSYPLEEEDGITGVLVR